MHGSKLSSFKQPNLWICLLNSPTCESGC
uniref:Uncharacterized protein n=1 Tax=Anguilla anguilla TaxID=7936 RepID=A0A0E9QX17_ANGAN